MDLQDTFYLVAIIYMVLMVIVAIAVLVVALLIKSKVTRLLRKINKKIDALQGVSDRFVTLLRAAQFFVKRPVR